MTQGVEVTALNDLLGVLRKQDPGITVIDPYESNEHQFNLTLALENGFPPDTYQVVSGKDLDGWIDKGVLAPIDALAAAEGWASVIPAPVLDSVSRHGSIYGVPLDVGRNNVVFYNKSVFAAQGVPPPKNLADVMAAATTLKAKGVTPFTVSAMGGWTIATLTFESVLVAQAGGDFFRSYFTGGKAPDSPEIRAALATVSSMMDDSTADRVSITWSDTVNRVCAGAAAMILLPDFIALQTAASGCAPDALGAVPMQPAGSPTFVFVSTVFPLPNDAPDPAAASEFLAVVGSKAGQEAFDTPYGASPARTDTDVSLFGPIARQSIADYRAPGEILVPGYAALTTADVQGNVNTALKAFADPSNAAYKNADAVIAVLAQNYSALAP
jgi:glucose/mannose transport system substrate-binding protein